MANLKLTLEYWTIDQSGDARSVSVLRVCSNCPDDTDSGRCAPGWAISKKNLMAVWIAKLSVEAKAPAKRGATMTV